jgi:protein-L-isoaspartate(D-aspartate) O-methyltransferase
MVESQLVKRGIRDARVLRAMSSVPRELFVPGEHSASAYSDAPLPIGWDQTISQPYMVAFMAEALELRGDEKVLDVGTGSGYHAAVLASLAPYIYSIEVIPELAEQARRNLRQARVENVLVIGGDGSRGYPEAMPYDAISVAAAAPDIPAALLDQLADPGRLVIPVGTKADQDLRVVWKHRGEINSRMATPCRFVPLVGEQGWR